ncbi:MAG: TIGR02556 family CRISPR-associated protein [Bacillota bacterium]|nr:TIGR02556 family CRISPR-associated protein [Bacillota bacterium]
MQSIKEIGNLEFRKIEGDDKYLEIFTEDFSKGTKYKTVFEIVIAMENDIAAFREIRTREYDDEFKFKYLYRSGSSRGSDITPTAKITEPQKTYINKIVAGFEDGVLDCDNNHIEEKKELQLVLNILKNEKAVIVKKIEEVFNSIPKKERAVVLTVVIQNSGEVKYIGDYEVFRKRVKEIPIKKFYYSDTYKKEVRGEKSSCSICNSLKDEVYGLASPFAFFTIDKPGYIAGNFNYERSWRNYPVCKQCAIELELGKNYLDSNLQLSFYGRKFYLIPKLIYPNQLEKVLRRYRSAFRNDEFKKAKDIGSAEEQILKLLSKEDNTVTFDLMFIEENNAALNILLSIEDVYPSTFSMLYNQWQEIRGMNFFNKVEYLANFNYINMLFNSKENNKYFLDTIDKIIGKGKIEYNFLISFINKKLVEAFIKEEKDEFIKGEDNYYIATLRAYTFIYYLYKLKKFRNKGESGVEDMEREEWNIKDFQNKRAAFEDFFSCNKAFFDSNSKRSVFMLGYLSKKLLNLQAVNENGRKPFMSNLNGLNITKRELTRLMPKIQGKFQEYKKEYYNEELELASQYLIESNNLNDLANLDIPLYFSMGMNMERKFKLSINDDHNDSVDGGIINDQK